MTDEKEFERWWEERTGPTIHNIVGIIFENHELVKKICKEAYMEGLNRGHLDMFD